jgi:hypothetical protein
MEKYFHIRIAAFSGYSPQIAKLSSQGSALRASLFAGIQ